MFKSTRGNNLYHASDAIIKGISDDGGLFIPIDIPSLLIDDLLNINYKDLAFKILRLYLDDYSDDEIKYCIDNAYNNKNFKEKLVGIEDFDKFSFLTLYHGPTMAFKDMALTILPHLLEVALKKHQDHKKTWILTATSGDTGSACMSGFSESKEIKTLVLYPNNGVSPLQERQMHAFNKNGSCSIAVNGNFDDCQTLVKKAFLEIKDNTINLASANSINVGRLIPQIVYYYYAYIELVNKNRIKLGDKINISVPTGNFGNIFAAFLAWKMGLPINILLCASNQNDVLTEFFNTGIYNKNRPFYQTLSPSMDILVSSNLERYLYLLTNKDIGLVSDLMNKLNTKGYYELDDNYKNKLNEFKSFCCNDEEIKNYILKCYKENNFLIDPHTACSYGAYCKYNDNHYTLVVSTASPFKFPKAYYDLFDIKSNDIFEELDKLSKLTNTPLDKKINELKNIKLNRKYLDINNESINNLKIYLGVNHE